MITNRFDLLQINFLNCSRKYIEITLENVEVYTGARKDKREKISKKNLYFQKTPRPFNGKEEKIVLIT